MRWGRFRRRHTTLETGAGTRVKQQGKTLGASTQVQGRTVFPFDAQVVDRQPSQPVQAALTATATPVDVLREAEAHQALAELFPHLKLDALRAIQDLFPLQAARNALLH